MYFHLNKLEINHPKLGMLLTLSVVLILYQDSKEKESTFPAILRQMPTHMIFCSQNGWDTFIEKLPTYIFSSVASLMMRHILCVPVVGNDGPCLLLTMNMCNRYRNRTKCGKFPILKDGYLYRLICGLKQGYGEILPLVNRVTTCTLKFNRIGTNKQTK